MKAVLLPCWLLLAGLILLAPNRASGAVAISAIGNRVVSEDSTTGPIAFSISGFLSRTPTVTGRSDNAALVPSTGIVIEGTGGSRTVTVTPAANQFGTATITLTVSDTAGTDTETFDVTVRAVSDPPTVTGFGDQTVNEDQQLGPLAFTIADVDTAVSLLTVTTSTSNQSLVPASAIAIGGSGANRTLTVSPAANLSGNVVIGVFVSDGNLSATTRFTLTVNAVNDPPVFSNIPDVSIDEDTDTGNISFSLSDVDSGNTALTITRRSSNTALVPEQNIVVTTVAGATVIRIVKVTPLPNQFGDAVITLIGSDGSASSEESFTLRVNPINDGPSVSDIPDQKIDEDTSTGPISFEINDIDTPAEKLVLSAVSNDPKVIPDANIVFGGSGNKLTVTVTPLPNQFGIVTITVSVSDGSLGTAARFTVSVAAVNDAPTISNIANQAISEDANTGALAFTVGDAETAVANLTVTATSSNTALVPNANVVLGGAGASRTVTVTPLANQSGTTTVTVTVSDGAATASDTFTVDVRAVNDAPTISDIANQAISEDANTGALAFTVGDAETAVANLTVTATSSNTALVPNANVVLGGSGASRTVTVTPLASQSGTTTVTVTVSDGAATASDTFTMDVRAVNDAPTISDVANQAINEDSNTGALAFTVGDAETAVANLTVTATSSNTALVPNANVVLGVSGASRTVTVTPLANQSGTTTVTVTVSDGAATASDTFTVDVRAVNDAPTISDIANQAISEDSNTGALAFTVNDVDTAVANLTVTATSSNTALVPNANVVLGGSGASRTVTVTPLANQSGTTTVTVTVSDGTSTASDTFIVDVGAVNDAPTISDIANQAINEDANTGPIAFTVGDVETAAANLTVQASSSITTLVPNANVVFGGSGASRTVTVTPLAGQSGTTTVTVTVSDGTSTSSDTFAVSVGEVNDPPTISNIANQSISEDTNTGALSFSVGDPETAATSLTVQASSSNTALVPNANVVVGGSGASRTVTVTPLANRSGTTTVTVTVSDGTSTASDTFIVDVGAVNDAPTLSDIADQVVNEDATTGPLAFAVGDVETAAANLTVQAASSNTALVPNANVILGGSGTSRTVTVTPLANQSGTTTVTVTVRDGTAAASDTFTVEVRAVNDPPTISDIANQNLQGGTSTGPIVFTVADPDSALDNLRLSVVSSDLVLVPLSAIALGGTVSSRTVTVTPVGLQGGSSTLTVTVTDGNLSASDSFVVTVSSTVVAPQITGPPASAMVNEGEIVTFRVATTGTAPFRYQWLFNGQDLPNATELEYVIRNAQASQAGEYTVRVSNSVGTVTSSPAVLTVVRLDYGDAPESSLAVLYRTRQASNGPRHRIVQGFFLGRSVDGESDGQPNADATGDDLNPRNLDDEDGVVFGSAFEPGKPATLIVTSSSQGVLDAWFDFNRAGGFESGERLISGFGLAPGANSIVVNVPSGAVPGETFARFRLSRTGVETPDHLGSTAPAPEGEVEDYQISVRTTAVILDFGDAPEAAAGTVGFGYPTFLSRNGARHVIVQGLHLGKTADAEPDGQPNPSATGDDLIPQNLDDEDGVEFQSPLVAGESAKIAVTASQTGRLDAWMDFNGNRSWADPGEQIFASTVLVGGVNTLNFPIPLSARDGVTFARFRFSRDGKLGFVGQASDGEVEDYQTRIQSGSPCDVNYKGTDFWLTFPGNYPPSPDSPLRLTLCIVGPQGITGTVTAPGLRYTRDFTIPASMVVDVVLPDLASLGDEVDVVESKGINVEASAPVAVYGLNRIPYSSDGYLGLPVAALGREYLVTGYPNVFSGVSALNGTQFALVATEDETSVTIIPSRNVLGHPGGDPFVVQLNQGQTYQLRDPNDATADLSGTELISDKPIAVFGGHQCANIESPSQMFCDHLVEQLLPVTAWGKNFYAVPLATRINGDTLRITGSKDGTQLLLNGAAAGSIDRGQVRRFTLAGVTRIDANRPVFVAQFARSSDFDEVENADPFMVTVPPIRYYTRDHMICTGPGSLATHHVNIVAPSSVVGVLTLDGVVVAAGAFTPIGASGFSSARLTVSAGPHALSAPQPFGSIVYGYGPYEAYGWPGGMFFGDITPPVITCPEDFTVNTGVVGGTTGALKCVALVPDVRERVTVFDNCELPTQRVLTQSPPPGTQVGPGKYVITVVAHDASGNEAECEVTMTVVDPGPATIVCPKDFTVICNKGAGASVAYQVVARTECGTLVPVDCTPASGALFPPGVTTVQCRIQNSPNQTCTFKVTVICPDFGKNGVIVRNPPRLSWTGDAILETSFGLEGPWTSVPEATSPFNPASLGERQFFRLRTAQGEIGLHSRAQAPVLTYE